MDPSEGDAPAATVIRLLDVRDKTLEVAEVLSAVEDESAGGTALFVGTVRSEDGGKPVTSLGYSAHPSVVNELRAVAERVAQKHDVRALAAVHRVGELAIGDIAVIAAVACGHRGEAFDACRQLVDDLKHEVPIWKHQRFADGTEEWVGSA
jgi:molybdopterin synthase catalytic subunit